MDVAESQERLELQFHFCGSVHQFIVDHELVRVRAEDYLLAENDFADLVGHGRDRICVEIHNVLVSARLIDVSVAVDSKVEALAPEGKAFVQGAEEEMPVTAELFNRYGQKAVVTPGVAGHDGRVAIGAGFIGQDDFPLEGILKVDQFRLIEFQKSHKYNVILASKP
jgi:hypothetical protein